MRNQFAGTCQYCKKTVEAGQGKFKKIPSFRGLPKWEVWHFDCLKEKRKDYHRELAKQYKLNAQ